MKAIFAGMLLCLGLVAQPVSTKLQDLSDVKLSQNKTPGLALIQATNSSGGRYWTNSTVSGSGGGTNTFGSGTPNTVAKWTGTNTLGDSLITSDNANNIIGAGANFTGTVIDTTTDIYAVGRGTLDTAAVTNSFDIYSFGDVNFGNAIINSADNLFGMGDATFQNAIFDGVNEIFAWGQQVFSTSTNVNSSTLLFGIGNNAFAESSIDGSSDVYGIGLDSMRKLAATNSTVLVGIGEAAFNDTFVTDSTEMFGFGDSPLRFSIFESCQRLYGFGNALYVVTITNATDVFGYGTEALRSASLSSASDVYAFGNGAALNLNGDPSVVYVFGSHAMESATNVNGSSSIYAFGSSPMTFSKMDGSSDIYAIGTDALTSARLTNSVDVYAIGRGAGQGVLGTFNNVTFLGANSTATDGAADAVILGPTTALQLGNTNRYTDDGTTLLRNGSPISATGDTTATNIVTKTQSGTNLTSALDFSLVQRGGMFKIALTNNLFIGTPTFTAGNLYHAWVVVQQPSTGTCFVTWTNATFGFPESNPWINDTNNGAVVYYEIISNPFTNTQFDVFMSQRMGR